MEVLRQSAFSGFPPKALSCKEGLNESEDVLILLSDIFSHSSITIPMRYLGIREETIENVFLTL